MPKEKAIELIDKFRMNVLDYEGSSINTHKAIQCALIVVDEVINANHYKWAPFMGRYTEAVLTSDNSYWIAVKQEIEKL